VVLFPNKLCQHCKSQVPRHLWQKTAFCKVIWTYWLQGHSQKKSSTFTMVYLQSPGPRPWVL